MTIDGIGYGSMGARGAGESREVERPGGREASGANRTTQSREDSVEISAEGRVLSESGLSPEQIEEFRSKIVDGTYDRPSVAEDVARRILASGDVI